MIERDPPAPDQTQARDHPPAESSVYCQLCASESYENLRVYTYKPRCPSPEAASPPSGLALPLIAPHLGTLRCVWSLSSRKLPSGRSPARARPIPFPSDRLRSPAKAPPRSCDGRGNLRVDVCELLCTRAMLRLTSNIIARGGVFLMIGKRSNIRIHMCKFIFPSLSPSVYSQGVIKSRTTSTMYPG